MPSSDFERALEVSSGPDACWSVLTDVQRVAGWVSLVDQVDEVTHLDRYTAVLEDSFGPFKLKADVDIEVTDLDEGKRIAFKARGKDRQVSTSINVDGSLELEPGSGETTVIKVAGRWNVIGTVATMGSGTIRQKADKIMEEFFESASAELNG